MSHWIKCSDQLPEIGKEVLIRIPTCGHWNVEGGSYRGDGIWDGAWCSTRGDGRPYKVLEWSEMPGSLCAHEWTDDGEFTLTCTKCGKTENHEPYGWVQTRGNAINHFTQEWDVVESWGDQGFEYKAMYEEAKP